MVWTKFLCYIVLHLIVVEACQEGGGVPSPASTCNPPPTLLRTSPPSTLSSALLKNFGNKGVSGWYCQAKDFALFCTTNMMFFGYIRTSEQLSFISGNRNGWRRRSFNCCTSPGYVNASNAKFITPLNFTSTSGNNKIYLKACCDKLKIEHFGCRLNNCVC